MPATAFDLELQEEVYLRNTPSYFIGAIGLDASRHYSQSTVSFIESIELFAAYKDLIIWIAGGGEVTLYRAYHNEIEILEKDYV